MLAFFSIMYYNWLDYAERDLVSHGGNLSPGELAALFS